MTATPDDLRDAGLRATQPRRDILAWLRAHPGHHAADEVASGTGQARATTYVVLDDLVGAGLLLVADTGPGRALYEAGTTFHHHFVCQTCGRVIDVPCASDSRPCLEAQVPGAEVDIAEVIYKGRCDDCRASV